MSFYEPQGWQAPARQASWEQPAPPSRSGASSTSQREEPNAFATQFEGICCPATRAPWILMGYRD